VNGLDIAEVSYDIDGGIHWDISRPSQGVGVRVLGGWNTLCKENISTLEEWYVHKGTSMGLLDLEYFRFFFPLYLDLLSNDL
jgi:hypothetical protein